MIERLKAIDPYDETEIDMDVNSVAGLVYENTPLIQKVNELIDAVNVLQAQVAILEEHAHPTATTEPADPYAEQRKWRGKLCKFWDDSDEPENCVYDVLCNIFDLHHEDCPFQCGNGEWYEYCEPVKPDDDIIYKGANK
jgi:hypothetical protein